MSNTFCSNLAFGIHAAAQPLAVLQASLGKEQTTRMSEPELRQLIASSALEVQRVCTIFHALQQLVMAETEPLVMPMPIVPVLEEVVEGVHLLFENDHIPLRTQWPQPSPISRIHRQRTLHALSRILLVAHTLATANSEVELEAAGQAIKIRVPQSRALTAENTLSLAIAAANLRSQHARFSHRLQPFEVEIELPPS
jgi:hypothetical protein